MGGGHPVRFLTKEENQIANDSVKKRIQTVAMLREKNGSKEKDVVVLPENGQTIDLPEFL